MKTDNRDKKQIKKLKQKLEPAMLVAGYFLRENKPAFACLI